MTMIELLAVTLIIAVLASLLVPTLSGVRRSAQAAKCAGNLKNIGSAFSLYAADNNNLFPAARWTVRPGREAEQNPTGRNWQSEVQPYLREGKSFADSRSASDQFIFCPTYMLEHNREADVKKLQAAGYGMNNSLATGSWDYRFNRMKIKTTSTTILAGDSDDYWLKVTRNLAPNADGRYSGYSDRCGDPVRHGEVANYLFVDGHVSALKQDEAAKYFEDYENYKQ
jgi:prepilin-type processing-associated H-X9-DG protein